MALLRTILIIVIAYYAFRFIARIVLPYLMKYFAGKMQQKMSDQFNNMNQRQQEGDIHINTQQRKNQKEVEAEDVDFEEVE